MRSNRFHEDEDSSDDSFLDVIANVVGVLIILVMLVGVRASHSVIIAKSAPPENLQETQPPPETQTTGIDSSTSAEDLTQLRAELDEARRQAITSQRKIEEVAVRIVKINRESAGHDQQRVTLAMHRAVIEEDMEQRRSKLGSHRQQEFDVQRKLVEAQINLDEMTKEQLTLATARPAVEKIECVPTPLAKTVEGESIHLRMHKGLVSIVPFDDLMDELLPRFTDLRRQIQTRNKVSETIGPQDGYRLRFTAIKRTTRELGRVLPGQVETTTLKWIATILPTADKIGQKVEQALMPGSALHEHLNTYKRKKPTVVIWLYNDSFNEFRPLKRALWERKFSVAVRTLRPGEHIATSPHGTKSSAQ